MLIIHKLLFDNLLGMEKVQPQATEVEEMVKGKHRTEEGRRWQRRLRRKRAHNEVNGEQQRIETGKCCQELDINNPCGFLPIQDVLGFCDPREVQVAAAPKLKG